MVVCGLMGLEKAYERVNRGALYQLLRMYNVGGKLFNRIKGMCVNSLVRVTVKGDRS